MSVQHGSRRNRAVLALALVGVLLFIGGAVAALAVWAGAAGPTPMQTLSVGDYIGYPVPVRTAQSIYFASIAPAFGAVLLGLVALGAALILRIARSASLAR